MNTPIKVARYHLVDCFLFFLYPWLILAIVFAGNLAIFSLLPTGSGSGHARYTGALGAIYLVFGIIGTLSIGRLLPFALALGVSRRSYYAGTALLAGAVAAANALLLTVLAQVEQATTGWGMDLHFFRVPFLLAGPWYLTWLTSFVIFAVLFAWGMWFGLVYRRWNLLGLTAFIAAQAIVLTAALVIVFRVHAWHGVAHFFATLTVYGLTGLLAVLAVIMLAGGYTTIRRVTV